MPKTGREDLLEGAQIGAGEPTIGATFNAATDESGFYRAPQLSSGTYTITVSQPGFRTLVRGGIEVRVNDRLRVDLTLEVGQVAEQLERCWTSFEISGEYVAGSRFRFPEAISGAQTYSAAG